ncbi:TetR-like C-terminal domain-containing protein [Streptomyces goshikiensis]|uniref:TetR-like C-terminal domain-containing protein n=1 Tax=Streptomyces goshikiensis TaxID=1942 RepID=UPI0038145C89
MSTEPPASRPATAAGKPVKAPDAGRRSERSRRAILDAALALHEDRLRTAREAGQLARDTDLRLTVEMLVGPLTYRWLLRTGPLTHAFTDALVDRVLGGVAGGTTAGVGKVTA